jgi:hypothetical protein
MPLLVSCRYIDTSVGSRRPGRGHCPTWPETATLIKSLIGDCGGIIDVIIRAMWVHSDSVSVQEWCCRALYSLSLDKCNSSLSLDKCNSSMVLEVGGISAVVNDSLRLAGRPENGMSNLFALLLLANICNCKQATREVIVPTLQSVLLAMRILALRTLP